MAHLRRVLSMATQHRLSGLSQPGTATTNAPNPLDTSSATRERSFGVRSVQHHIVLYDVLFSPPKICFFTQIHGSNHYGHRVCHRPPLMTRRLRGSSWRGDGKDSWWGNIAIHNCFSHSNFVLTFIFLGPSTNQEHSTANEYDGTIKFKEMVSGKFTLYFMQAFSREQVS